MDRGSRHLIEPTKPNANRRKDSEGRSFRRLIERPGLLVIPGAYDALSARIIDHLGFPAVYATGAGITNSFLAQPDLGLITMNELVRVVGNIVEAVSVPVVVDADTGFGNALNVGRTVRELERAGAAAIQIEDQVSPKRCGHFNNKQVTEPDEMVSKIMAAVDARRDNDLVIIARTDAIDVLGFEEAINRARLYRSAGADMTFVEAPTTVDQVKNIPRELEGIPQIANLVEGGKTPILPFAELEAAGYRVAVCANTALRASIRGVSQALSRIKQSTSLLENEDLIATWEERQGLVGLHEAEEWLEQLSASAKELERGATGADPRQQSDRR